MGAFSDDPIGSIADLATVFGLAGALLGLVLKQRGDDLGEFALIGGVLGGLVAVIHLLTHALHLVNW